MKTVNCASCYLSNDYELASCKECGESLAGPKLEYSISEIKKTTERMRELTTPRKTFYSINGCGTTLLDYHALPDGTYAATRWVTIFGLPIVPLSGYVIEPTSQDFNHVGQTSRFNILNKTSLAIDRVVRTYLLAAVGVLPLLLGALNSSWVNHTLGGPLAFVAMIACFVWLIFIIFYKLKNDGKAYKAKDAIKA